VDGRAARWQAHKDERRRLVVDTAIAMVEAGEGDASVADIGARAGLSRSVVYRLFADRREIDVAVQRRVLAGLRADILAALTLSGTIRETLAGVIGVYVEWAAAHPRLHRLADYDTAIDGNGPLQQVVGEIATGAVDLLEAAIDQLRGDLPMPSRGLTEPFAHGLVGMVFATVRRWVHRSGGEVEADLLVGLLTAAVWAQIDVLARAIGLQVDPDGPVEEWFRPDAP
jgi:AcrR family transcriptional regulator